jgi:hypothetical protein
MKIWLRLALITTTGGGGFTGIALTLSLFRSQGTGFPSLILLIGFLVLYVFVLTSGLLFVRDPQRTGPLLAALAVQIPYISTPLIVYKFAAGVYAVVKLEAQQGTKIGVDLARRRVPDRKYVQI